MRALEEQEARAGRVPMEAMAAMAQSLARQAPGAVGAAGKLAGLPIALVVQAEIMGLEAVPQPLLMETIPAALASRALSLLPIRHRFMLIPKTRKYRRAI